MPTKPPPIIPTKNIQNNLVVYPILFIALLASFFTEYLLAQSQLKLEQQVLEQTTQDWLITIQNQLQQQPSERTPLEYLPNQLLLQLSGLIKTEQIKIYQGDGTYYQNNIGNPVQNYLVTQDDTDHGAFPVFANHNITWKYYFEYAQPFAPEYWVSEDREKILFTIPVFKDGELILIEVAALITAVVLDSGIASSHWALVNQAANKPAYWDVYFPWTLPWRTLFLAGFMFLFWLWFTLKQKEKRLPTQVDIASLQSSICHELNIMAFQTDAHSIVQWITGNPPAHIKSITLNSGDSMLEVLQNSPKYLKSWQRSLEGEKFTFEINDADVSVRIYQWPILNRKKQVKAVNVVVQDISEHRQIEWQLQQQHLLDPVTGLPNRQFVVEQLQHDLQISDFYQEEVALVAIELGGISHVSSQTDIETCNNLIRQITTQWQQCLTVEQTLSRLSHEEFLIITNNAPDPKKLKSLAEKLIDITNSTQLDEHLALSIKANIGIAFYPRDAQDAGSLISNAMIAKGHARKIGANTVDYFCEENTRAALERWQLEKSLAKAISAQDFALHYQPIFDMERNQCIAAEALIRWPSTDLMPDQFIPLAEESGLIHPIGFWVIESALHDFTEWKKQQLDIRYVSVNLSVEQLKAENFFSKLDEVLQQYPIKEGELLLEITESVMMQTNPDTIKNLNKLRQRGIQLAIDDFGTGFSSLNYLKNLPVNTLKIDRAFIPCLADADQEDFAICEAIIQLARTMNLKSVAEGVETPEQMEWLHQKGVIYAQGYFFAKPVKVDTFKSYLKSL